MDEQPQQLQDSEERPDEVPEPATPSPVRYNRKWFLVLGGAAVAGMVGIVAGLKTLAGSGDGADAGGPLSDMFGPFPVRSVEDVPDVPAADWVIKVDGLVDRPLQIDSTAWTSLRRLEETVDFHCVEGWSVDNVRWGGVTPAVLLAEAGVKPEAKYAVFHARGGTYLSTVPLDLVTAPKTVLADRLNNEPLPAKHGGPVRLVVPDQLGYKSVKWVVRIELTHSVPRRLLGGARLPGGGADPRGLRRRGRASDDAGHLEVGHDGEDREQHDERDDAPGAPAAALLAWRLPAGLVAVVVELVGRQVEVVSASHRRLAQRAAVRMRVLLARRRGSHGALLRPADVEKTIARSGAVARRAPRAILV